MVEEDAVANEKSIRLAIVCSKPMSRQLADGVGTSRMKWRGLILRRRRRTIHLGGTCLIETHAALPFSVIVSHGLEEPESAGGNDIGRIFRLLERNLHVRLRTQVVNLNRLGQLEDAAQTSAVRKVAVVQMKRGIALMWIDVDMVDSVGVECG